MNEAPDPHKPDPSVFTLVLKGVLLIIGAFLSAAQILIMHFPSGH